MNSSQRSHDVHSLLIAASASLVFMDLEVFQVAGKSIVLPYLVTFALGATLFARPSRFRHAFTDPVLPFLLAWVLVACFCSVLGYLRYQREPFLRYERNDLLIHDTTQIVNLVMMLAQYVIFVCALRSTSPRQLTRVVGIFVGVGVVGAAYALYQMGFVLFGWPYRELFRTSNLYLRA
jgi:hypothetical protein